VQILQKHPWVIFIEATCLQMSASMPTISIIFATTSQNFMVFQIRGHRFLFLGQHFGNQFGLTIQNFSI
jgi:hypothetical protein